MSKQLTEHKYSVITTCKGRLHHLKETLPCMTSDEHAEVIVVDYDCPQGTYDWVKTTYRERVKLVKFSDRPKFNASIARNAGAKVASCEVLIFIDADIIAHENSLRSMAAMCNTETYVTISQGTEAKEKNNKQTTGTVAIHRTNFDKVEGYDEVFDSWGGEDSDIYNKLYEICVKNAKIPADGFSSIDHSNTDRLKFHDEKNLKKSAKQTQILVDILAVARKSRVNLNEKQKSEIYALLKKNKNLFNNIKFKLENSNTIIDCRRRNYFIGPMQVSVRTC